jgi:hypothetical protein
MQKICQLLQDNQEQVFAYFPRINSAKRVIVIAVHTFGGRGSPPG